MSPTRDDLQLKIHLIRECLAQRFHDVLPHSPQQDRFVFNDGAHSFQFGFSRPAMEALPLDRLRTFMETEAIPLIVQNPGMQTFYEADGLSVRDTVPT
ncbi:MAG: hypothetical protein NDI90_10880 [Nitrospira sp. BO4]|nr:hypothetical protein [Nitrospira sp. BO4]